MKNIGMSPIPVRCAIVLLYISLQPLFRRDSSICLSCFYFQTFRWRSRAGPPLRASTLDDSAWRRAILHPFASARRRTTASASQPEKLYSQTGNPSWRLARPTSCEASPSYPPPWSSPCRRVSSTASLSNVRSTRRTASSVNTAPLHPDYRIAACVSRNSGLVLSRLTWRSVGSICSNIPPRGRRSSWIYTCIMIKKNKTAFICVFGSLIWKTIVNIGVFAP